MPAHPVSRLVRFTLAVGTNVPFDHLAIGDLQPTPCTWSRPSSLLPATSSTWPTATIAVSPWRWCGPGWIGSVSIQRGAVSCAGQRPGWRLPTSTASPRRFSGRPPPPGCVRCADSCARDRRHDRFREKPHRDRVGRSSPARQRDHRRRTRHRPPRPRRPRIRAPVDLAVDGRVACLFFTCPSADKRPATTRRSMN